MKSHRLALFVVLLVAPNLVAQQPPLQRDGEGQAAWIERYNAEQEGELAGQGEAVLEAFWDILEPIELDGLDEGVRQTLLENALYAAQRQVRQRIRAEAAQRHGSGVRRGLA